MRQACKNRVLPVFSSILLGGGGIYFYKRICLRNQFLHFQRTAAKLIGKFYRTLFLVSYEAINPSPHPHLSISDGFWFWGSVNLSSFLFYLYRSWGRFASSIYEGEVWLSGFFLFPLLSIVLKSDRGRRCTCSGDEEFRLKSVI